MNLKYDNIGVKMDKQNRMKIIIDEVTKQDRMDKIVSYFQNYVATYSDQQNYKTYSDRIFIDDMLYGIGIAINKNKYQNAVGYRLWKKELIKYMNNQTYDFSELTGKL